MKKIINQGQPSVYDYVFPVFGANRTKEGLLDLINIYGTAFYISNNTFITCKHTIVSAEEYDCICLGYVTKTLELGLSVVSEVETFDDNDSAILNAVIDRAVALPWLSQKLAMANNVNCAGYAYGFDKDNSQILVRSYSGTISMVGVFTKFAQNPQHYEISFMCPRGLSGAPLIFIHDNKMLICGMAIGNERTSMVVWSSKEVNEEDGTKTVFETEEALHRGIAVQTQSFFKLKSRILGMTIEDYLKKEQLLI